MLAVCWSYLAAVVAVWLLICLAGDRWWVATVMMLGPRWVWLFPLFVLLPLCVTTRRRRLTFGPLLLGAAIVVGGTMGFCIPWRAWFPGDSPQLRVLTCNVEGNNCGTAALHNLIVKVQPDVVALQECPKWDQEVLGNLFPEGWTVRRGGSLLVATPHSIVATQTHKRNRPPSRWPPVNGLYCVIESPGGRVGLCSVHQRTPRPGLYIVLDRQTGLSAERSDAVTAETERRRIEAEDLAEWIQGHDGHTLVAGDFNMPVESAIYRNYWARFDNAFGQVGFGFGATKMTRVHGFRYGLRIDHILLDDGLRAHRAWVADTVGSDHLPLVADVAVRR